MSKQDKKLLKKIEKEKAIRAKIELKGRRNTEPNLLNISNAIDEYYCLNKLKLYCAYLSYTKFTNDSHIAYGKKDFLFLEQVVGKISSNYFSNPLIKIYNNLRLLFEVVDKEKEPADTTAEKQIIEIEELVYSLSEEEQVDIFSYLTNYFTYRFNQNHVDSLKKFLIYSVKMLAIKLRRARKKDKFLPPTTFRNIVTAALHLKEETAIFTHLIKADSYPTVSSKSFNSGIEWVEQFMDKYQYRLSPPDARHYYNYSLVLLLFHKQQYGKAYRLLGNPQRQQGMFINLNTRSLHLVILYEVFNKKPALLEYDAIEIPKVIESFRGLIRDDNNRKKQVNQNYLAIYKKFGQLFSRLYALNLKYKGLQSKPIQFTKMAIKLQLDIEDAMIPYKPWMRLKLKELIGKDISY